VDEAMADVESSPDIADLLELRSALEAAEHDILLLQRQRRRIRTRLTRQIQNADERFLVADKRFTVLEQAQTDCRISLGTIEGTMDHQFGTLHQMMDDHSREMEDVLDRVADLECNIEEREERDEIKNKDLSAYEERLQQLIKTTSELQDTTKQLFEAELAAMRKARAEVAAAAITAQVITPTSGSEPPRDSLKRKRLIEDVDGHHENGMEESESGVIDNMEPTPTVAVVNDAERPRKRLRRAIKAAAHTVAAAAVGALATVVILSLD
jgi:hypothetical protein